jgi:FkbM family methyltransferase
MFLISPMLNVVARCRGPVAQHNLHLSRMGRWRKGEPEWHLLDHLVDPARAAIDVGANVGLYAGRLAQLCPRVHAFEPIPWLADALAAKLPDNVRLHRIALSDQPGTAELRIPFRADVEEHGLATLEDNNRLEGEDIRRVACTLARLEDVVTEPVGFIKIDVEGHELAVLNGARRILREHRPVLLVESEKRHHPGAPQNVFDLMREEGYSGLFLSGGLPRGLGALGPDCKAVNFIFLPNR